MKQKERLLALFVFAASDGPHLRGLRFISKLPDAVERALALHN